MEKLSASMENYLKTIYCMSGRHSTARVSDVAVKMEVSKASVSKAVSILANRGLVCKLNNRALHLTPEGMKHAALVLNKHEIIRKFLIEVLNIAPCIADKDACSFEHGISFESLQAMCRYLEIGDGLAGAEALEG
jgi:DtxR family Mn-dependent transcriptional regulator